MGHLCQTPEFQTMVMDILEAVIPQDSEELMDMRGVLFSWKCADRGVLHTQSISEPGVPVVLIPFVLERAVPRDAKDPDFKLLQSANELLAQIYAVFKELGHTALGPKDRDHALVKTANAFVMEYVRYTYPDSRSMQALIGQIVPAVQDETRADLNKILLEVKQLFYGLHGYCMTSRILANLLSFDLDAYLAMARLQAATASIRLEEE